MKNQEDHWPRKKVKSSQLVLDKENPRLPRDVRAQADEKVTLDYLLRKESVMQIAESISNNGYHQSSISIVYRNGNKYVVLDGNRRLAACQILDNPKIVTDVRNRKRALTLQSDMPEGVLDEIWITIAPSRKAASKEIWDIHVSKLAKSWEVLQQLRVYSNLIDTGDMTIQEAAAEYNLTVQKFKRELAKLYFCEKILESANVDDEGEFLKPLFNRIDRVMLSRNGQKLLGYKIEDVDDNGVINFQNLKTAEDKISQLIPFMLDSDKIPAQITQKELEENIYPEIDPVLFPPKSGKKKQPPKPINLPPWVPPKKDWVTSRDYKEFTGGERAQNLLRELSKNKPVRGKNLNMVAVSLRVLIELAVYESLKDIKVIAKMTQQKRESIKTPHKMPRNWSPTLKEMLQYMSKEPNNVVKDQQRRKTLERFLNDRGAPSEFLAVLDNFVHNPAFMPTDEQVRDLWNSFCRPILEMLSEMKEGT